MVTTNRLIPVDTFGSDPHGLVHLTGSLQVVARVTLGVPDGAPARVELLLDGAQVRGLGVETGARYEARGAYRLLHDPAELPITLDLVSVFELLGHTHDNPRPTRLLLVVRAHARVQADGRVKVGIEAPKLIASPSG
jgi:hypothetical protein